MLATVFRTAALAAAAAIGAALSCAMLPIPVAAQVTTPGAARLATRAPVTVEQYLSRARLDPTVAGAPARLTGVGARVLWPVSRAGGGEATLSSRLAVGGFATYAPPGGERVGAAHYGLAADLRLRAAPIAGRIDPLVSLGIGALRARRESAVAASPGMSPACFRPLDLAAHDAPPCARRTAPGAAEAVTRAAASPAAALRIALSPRVALRTDLRDVIVYRGRARHNAELAVGLSVTR